MNMCVNGESCICGCHKAGAVGCTDCLDALHIPKKASEIICAQCDGAMKVSDEKGKPMMMLTGDVDTGNEKIAVCPHCNNRQVLKD